MKNENALYILGFLLLIVALVAFNAPQPVPGQSLSVETILDKLPSVVATIVLTPLVLLFAGIAFRAYRVWERNQRQARRQPQRSYALPKAGRLSLDQLYKGWMMQQMGIQRPRQAQNNDDRPRMEF